MKLTGNQNKWRNNLVDSIKIYEQRFNTLPRETFFQLHTKEFLLASLNSVLDILNRQQEIFTDSGYGVNNTKLIKRVNLFILSINNN